MKRTFLLPAIILLAACDKAVEVDLAAAPPGAIKQGVDLMSTYCQTCHGVGKFEIDEMLAPPLWAVRAHYLGAYPEPEAFVDAMAAFIIEPQQETSRMPLAVADYGLKAPISMDEEKIRAVVWAIYAGQVEKPSWSRDYEKRHRDCEAVW